ncbi:MAG: hypothetical protein ACLFUS_08865 [Candidatus Sumerlaeia bacterium]
MWDWDAWLSNVALGQILADLDDAGAAEEAWPHEQGCVLNYIAWQHKCADFESGLPEREPPGDADDCVARRPRSGL